MAIFRFSFQLYNWDSIVKDREKLEKTGGRETS